MCASASGSSAVHRIRIVQSSIYDYTDHPRISYSILVLQDVRLGARIHVESEASWLVDRMAPRIADTTVIKALITEKDRGSGNLYL